MHVSKCLFCAGKCFGMGDTSGGEVPAADGLCEGASVSIFPDPFNIYEHSLSV